MEPSTLFNILIAILLIKFVLDTVLKHLNAKHFNDKTPKEVSDVYEIIEFFCADSIRKKEELTLEEWALRFDILLQDIKTIFSPNLIILGGGISKKYDKFKQYLNTDVKIKVAKFKNNAGIIGAAMYASKKINK